ncbi:amino acid adenylation domain-containing protein [Amycolatopsis sp. lyj-23]|uniref:amino acid adenylation domain-containing protein n=1 Tax=Amycolatopsis sp. lyj-23 TaxID=2789283 RepID=UPI00397828F6
MSPDSWNAVLARHARREPAKTAFTHLPDDPAAPPRSLGYGELDRRARGVAALLAERGHAGEPVLLLYPSGLDYVVAFFGCLYAGCVAVPAYPPNRRAASAERIAGIVADSGARAALTDGRLLERLGPIGVELISTEEPGEGQWCDETVDASSVAFLQYTSGSTGEPKGVVLTHGNLLANAALTAESFGTSGDTTVVSWLPMYHDMGLIGSLLGTVYCGGSCVTLSPASFVREPIRWLRAIGDYRATASGGPNFGYDLCAERITAEQRETLDLSSWRVAFNGAEPLREDTIRTFADTFADTGFDARAMTPCYGLAEATLMVSAKPAGTDLVVDTRGAAAVVGSGRPVAAGHRLEIVDPATATPCPDGTVGEIWFAGPSVAAGYWNRPEQTGATFRAQLTGEETPFLRTGDLGYLDGGELYVTGRAKDLLIIRGRNHYPQDIERTVEASHPALVRGGGAAFGVTADGTERLVVVHEVGREHRHDDLSAVTAAARSAVAAAHEVQPHAVVLIRAGTLPRTSSGKVRRQACRAAFLDGELAELAVATSSAVAATATPAAARLGADIAALLGRAPDDVTTGVPLLELGLDSVDSVRLAHWLHTEHGVRIDAEDLLDTTVEQIAAAPAGPRSAEAAAEPAGDHPLSAGQQSLWFVEQLDPGNPAHIVGAAVRVRGDLDVAALERALSALSESQASLRTTFPVVAGEPVRRVHVELAPEFEHHEVSGVDELSRIAHRPFDVGGGPLLRVGVAGRGDDERWLVLAAHHLVADLWSMEILLRELETLYRDLRPLAVRGTQPVLPSEAETEALEEFWREQLSGAPARLDLPGARPRRAGRPRGDRHELTVDAELLARLEDLAREQQVTLYDVLLAAYQLTLSRDAGVSDVVVGSPVHGRDEPGAADVIGYFVNMLPLRGRFRPEQPLADVLRRTHRTTTDARRHAGLPFATLVERLRPERDPGTTPFFQAVFTYQPGPLGALALGRGEARLPFADLELSPVPLRHDSAQFDLLLTVGRVGAELGGTLEFDADRYDRATAQRLAGRFRATLAAFATGTAAVAEPAVVLPRELTHGAEPGAAKAAHELFAEHAAAAPHDIAVSWDGGELTYAELESRANRLAHRLRAAGAGPERLVAIFLPRCAEWLVSVLAVFKAGAAYLPLDPAHPAERVSYVLADSGAAVLITRAGAPEFDGVVLDLDTEDLTRLPERFDAGPVDPHRLAYVIYTSGSTGRPKGVLVEHGSLANLIAGMPMFGFGDGERWTLFHSTAFDFSVWETWGALARGGTVVVVGPDAARDPQAFWDLVRRHRVTVLSQTPAVFALLTGAAPDRLAELDLRHIVFGGEKLEAAQLTDWWAHGNGTARLSNTYGITEVTVLLSDGPVAADAAGPPPLGLPMAGTELHLLDEHGEPAGIGVTGELHVGGLGVARGYLGKPALTAERFVPHPSRPGARLYRSGDLARRNADGSLDYLGRTDHQIKIRGHRIEAGEVEAALEELPGVRQAVVVAGDDAAGQRRLVAYLAGTLSEVDVPVLRARLGVRLPGYMIPARFVPLAEFPLTANGKIDRAALPDPGRDAGEYAEPSTESERRLAELIGGMLKAPRVGAHDDLLALGGHSLMVARLALRIQDVFAVDIPLRELFTEEITVARIARLVDAAVAAGATAAPARRIGRADRARYAAGTSGDRLSLPDGLRRTRAESNGRA